MSLQRHVPGSFLSLGWLSGELPTWGLRSSFTGLWLSPRHLPALSSLTRPCQVLARTARWTLGADAVVTTPVHGAVSYSRTQRLLMFSEIILQTCWLWQQTRLLSCWSERNTVPLGGVGGRSKVPAHSLGRAGQWRANRFIQYRGKASKSITLITP